MTSIKEKTEQIIKVVSNASISMIKSFGRLNGPKLTIITDNKIVLANIEYMPESKKEKEEYEPIEDSIKTLKNILKDFGKDDSSIQYGCY